MIDYAEILREIRETEEHGTTSYGVLERMTPLYCAAIYQKIFEKQGGEGIPSTESTYATRRAAEEASEFLRAVRETDSDRAWAVMDELMDTLLVVNERVYRSVMRKLGAENYK